MFYPGIASKNGTLASLHVLVPVWTLTANYVLIFSEQILSPNGYFLRADIFSRRIFSPRGYFLSADIFGEAGNLRPPTLTAR